MTSCRRFDVVDEVDGARIGVEETATARRIHNQAIVRAPWRKLRSDTISVDCSAGC